ncbi:MAG: cytochrome c biogenesis protein ResB [Acidobacteria bacterium]|nr:cytochrome c biogenesis protein ResB [Acidobacteriota bacterium]
MLILFLGHFVAHQFGFDADVRLTPDTNPQVLSDFNLVQKSNTIQLIKFKLDKQERFNVELPFTITCLEIEQRLIDTGGQIEINNTMDWRTRIKIDDPGYGETIADVSLNNPYTYRGYRFFQASAITIGSASSMTFQLTPEDANEQPVTLTLKRNESAVLPNGTKVEYENFLPDFVMRGNQFTTQSAEYNNPVAVLRVTTPAKADKPEETIKVFAFANKLPDNAPVAAPKAGYRWHMSQCTKSPLAHVLSIKYDPFNAAFIAWYIGGFGLMGALMFVFFTSHRRIWAMVEKKSDGKFEVVFGGDANRNHLAFEDKFRLLVERFSSNSNK